MQIRPERQEEYRAITQLVQTAFATAKVSDGTEQEFVKHLRASGNYIPSLALVAVEEEELIGHIMLTRTRLHPTKGGEVAVLLLAPLCVKLEKRNQGVGGALVEASFRQARQLGYPAVFLLGDPAYYGRFGFRAAEGYGIRESSKTLPGEFVLACELEQGALQGKAGEVDILEPESGEAAC